MEGHSLCPRGFSEDSAAHWITSLKEEKKSVLSTSVPRVTEKRTLLRDITDNSRCDRSLTKVHRCHIDPEAIRRRGTEDLNQASLDGNAIRILRHDDVHVDAHFFAMNFEMNKAATFARFVIYRRKKCRNLLRDSIFE